jgi:flagellar FliL protein
MKSILIIVGIVGVMAVAAFFLTTHVIKPALAPEGVAAGAGEDGAKGKKERSKKESSDEGEETPGEVYLVSDLLVNPTGTGGTRYLSATVGLEVDAPEVAAELAERDIQVRDVLISILSARSVEQLTDFQARERMRREIKQRLCKLLGSEALSAVYFVDYVLQ